MFEQKTCKIFNELKFKVNLNWECACPVAKKIQANFAIDCAHRIKKSN